MTSAREALDRAAERLVDAGILSARADAEWLLAWVLGTSRSALHAGGEISREQAAAFEMAIRRRASREPLQHITGQAGFRYLDLEVGPGVFVPRPETEVLAEAAVQELQRRLVDDVSRPLAVDLCAGSGAIALAMASEVPGCRVVAVELSLEAAGYAERNSTGTDVEIRCGDIASAVDDLVGQAHVVTANPPYIPLEAYESVAVEARTFDPPVALWSGSDGLDMIRTVADVGASLLVDGGLLLCEHADVQGDSAPAVFMSSGAWASVRDRPDLTGRPRFVSARRVPRSSGTAGTITG